MDSLQLIVNRQVEPYPQPVHGYQIQGFPMCSFEILVIASDMEGSTIFVWKKDSYTFHTLH